MRCNNMQSDSLFLRILTSGQRTTLHHTPEYSYVNENFNSHSVIFHNNKRNILKQLKMRIHMNCMYLFIFVQQVCWTTKKGPSYYNHQLKKLNVTMGNAMVDNLKTLITQYCLHNSYKTTLKKNELYIYIYIYYLKINIKYYYKTHYRCY